MEQTRDGLGLRKLVIQRHSMLRWQYVHRNFPFFQKIERLARHVKALGHSAGEDDYFPALLQQFLHIGNLDAGFVTHACVAPVPFTRSAREKLCILVRLGRAVDFETAPRNMRDSRRTIAGLDSYCHFERSEKSRIIITDQEQNEPEVFLPRLRDQDDSVVGNKNILLATALRAVAPSEFSTECGPAIGRWLHRLVKSH